MIILSATFGFRSNARAGVSANPGVSPWQPFSQSAFSQATFLEVSVFPVGTPRKTSPAIQNIPFSTPNNSWV